MRFFIQLSVLFLLLLSFPCYSQTDSTINLSINEAIDYALNNRPEIKNTILQERIAKNQIEIASSALLPQITGTIDARDNIRLQTTFIPNFANLASGERLPIKIGTQYYFFTTLEISQPIFDATYFPTVKYFKKNQGFQSKNSEVTIKNIKEEVYQSYYSVLLNKEKLELSKKNEESAHLNYENGKIKFQNESMLKTELNKLYLNYRNAQTLSLKDEYNLKLSLEFLSKSIGLESNLKINLTNQLEIEIKNDSLDMSFEQLDKISYAENKPEFQAQKLQLELTQYSIKKINNDYYPKLNLYGYFSEQAYSNNINLSKWYPYVYAGLKLTAPIYDGMRKKNNADELKLQLQTGQNNLAILKQNFDYELRSSWVNMKNSYDNLMIWNENIKIAEEVLKTDQVRFKENNITVFELTNSELTLKETQTNYMNAMYEYLISKVKWMKAKGNL